MLDKLLEIDGNILLWIQDNIRFDFLNPIMKGITMMGDNGLIWIALALLLTAIPKTRKVGIVCLCSMAVTFIVCNLGMKNIVARTRPYEVIDGLQRLVAAETSYSFPSGHSSSAFACAVVIFKEMPKKFGIPALSFAIIIALSRLYVGVHYPSDVLSGVLLGTILALLTCYVYHKIVKDKSKIK